MERPSLLRVGICLAVKNPVAGWDCGARIASTPDAYLSDPAVSPNGHTLAVTVLASRTSSGGHIALYDYDTHAFVRNLTNGSNDALPQWSPDGSQIVYQRRTSLYITAANASPGREKLLISSGETPTWGGTPDPAASGLTLAGSQRGTTVRARLVIRLAGSKIDARVLGMGRMANRLFGRTLIRRVAAGGRAVAVALNNSGRAALKRQYSLKAMLRITVTPPIGAATLISRIITLRK